MFAEARHTQRNVAGNQHPGRESRAYGADDVVESIGALEEARRRLWGFIEDHSFMIRSNVPMPLLFRLRMRANLLAGRAQTGLSSHKKRSGLESERALWTNKTFRTSTPPGGPVSTECTPALWSEFVDQYEKFTGALCCAAKDGCTTAVEREFAIARRWFSRFYPVVAIRFRPFLEAEFTSTETSSGDALESMFRSSTLREMLQSDSGDLIPRIHRISEAVYRCHASLQSQ